MKLKNLLSRYSIKATARELGYDVRLQDGQMYVNELLPHPLWAQRLSSKSSFCRAVVQSGLLTQRQMVHAALRYRLGRSKDDAVIYWQIDQLGHTHDGKMMWYGPDCHRLKERNATWVMYLLRRHYNVSQDTVQATHCFFGLHLLSHTKNDSRPSTRLRACPSEHLRSARDSKPICIVEAEKSAVILSELFPQYIWLAAGGMGELQVNKFLPLRHHRVILFPDTDPDQRTYNRWYAAAQDVMNSFFWLRNNPISVSALLELRATDEQKQRKIDLVDYLTEQRNQFEFKENLT